MRGPQRSAIQRAADENMVAAYALLVPYLPPPAGIARHGEAVAIVTGTPSPFFNPVLGVGDDLSEAALRAALDYATQRGVGPSLQIRSDLAGPAAALADELGYLRDAPDTPGMVLDSLPRRIPDAPSELRIATVTDDASADAWFTAAGPLGPFIPRGFGFDPAVRMVVGTVDGVPVASALVASSDGAHGLYAVGTIESARRRGYGTAITWAAIAAGREAWGEMPVILQASEMGLPVYLKMGFREICRYAIWYPPKPMEPSGTADASADS